jgi:hypothetical protein
MQDTSSEKENKLMTVMINYIYLKYNQFITPLHYYTMDLMGLFFYPDHRGRWFL